MRAIKMIEIWYDMKEIDSDSHCLTVHEPNWLTSALTVFDALTTRYSVVEMYQGDRAIRKYNNL